MTGFENKPVTFTGFLDAMRFTNWMQNGQGNGNTESGVYDLSGGGLVARTSSPSIQFWIPTENEWYKAAYYNPTLNSGAGGYYLYPTQSNTAPTSGSAITGQANMANFGSTAGGLTNVGSYDNSASFYGTFDQGGNLWEWNEAINGTDRVMRGGAWDYPASTLLSTTRSSSLPNTEGDRIGFRLAMLESVPEPSRLLLMALGAALGLLRRRRAAA